ncbi:hypothetical protein [Pontibacter arcticus]|uniref:hypothetical protein n=1 Tax=Pontibacter arcticus TaxID=2080288 RepID=UPI000F6167A0|nr:hypothetical protein [Pontibacter arcticus]
MIKILIRFLFPVVLFLTAHVGFAQNSGGPRALAVKGSYIHSQTKTEFPKDLLGYERKGIYSFNKKKSNIGATYKSKKGGTTVSVYLYPSREASEDRLRIEYASALGEITMNSKKGITSNPGLTSYARDGYKVNGVRAQVTDVRTGLMSHLSVYECGKWFLKLRISSNLLDSVAVSHLEYKILDQFVPTDLVRQDPFKSESTIYFAPAAFADSLLLVSAMGGAFKKVKWALDNVDSLERAAGFPGLYLDLHAESLTELAHQGQIKQETKKWTRQPETSAYLSELNTIIESGYLREFIMDQYNMLLIVPKDVKLDFKAYQQWKLIRPTRIDLNERLYVISYINE